MRWLLYQSKEKWEKIRTRGWVLQKTNLLNLKNHLFLIIHMYSLYITYWMSFYLQNEGNASYQTSYVLTLMISQFPNTVFEMWLRDEIRQIRNCSLGPVWGATGVELVNDTPQSTVHCHLHCRSPHSCPTFLHFPTCAPTSWWGVETMSNGLWGLKAYLHTGSFRRFMSIHTYQKPWISSLTLERK